MKKKTHFILIVCFIVVLAVISGIMSWYKALPRFHEVLGTIDTIEKPLFFEVVFRFEDYSAVMSQIAKDEPDRITDTGFAVREAGGTYWICDPYTAKAYTPVPEYNLLDQSSIVRILPDTSVGDKFSSLRGLYRCTLFIRDDPRSTGLTRVITLYLKSLEKISRVSLFNSVRKVEYIKPEPDIEEIRLWRDLINERYPSVAAPVFPADARQIILFHSVPQGLPVYAVTPEKIDECVLDGKVDTYLLREKVLTKEYHIGTTPFVLQYASFFNRIVLYEFITTSVNLLGDGQVLETVERMRDNPQFYRIVRGYSVTAGRKEQNPLIHTALFQLKGLAPDEIIYFIGQSNSFPVDEDMLEVTLKPVLQQARREIIHPEIDVGFCNTVLVRAGKLNIETSVGNYTLALSELASSGYSVVPVGRSAGIIRQDEESLYRLRDFIYRK